MGLEVSDKVVTMSADGLDPVILFNLLPRRLPARVKSTRGGKSGTVHLLIPAVYPDGERIEDIYCIELHGALQYDEVLVEWEEVPESRRNGRPHLIQGVEALRAERSEIEQEKKRFEEYIGGQVREKLQQAIDTLENERKAVAASVEEQVARQLAEQTAKLTSYRSDLDQQKRKLDEREQNLTSREQALDETVSSLVEEKLVDRSFELDARESALRNYETRLKTDIAELEVQQNSLKARWAKLVAERARFEAEGGQLFIDHLKAVELENERTTPAHIEPSGEPFDPHALASALAKSGYSIDADILSQAVVASLAAWAGGQFVILSGPTGVGKTRLVRQLSNMLGMGYGLVAVRPSWVEPSDLLGFYNPIHKLYEAAPTLDRLIRAEQFTAVDRLYALCFDEMNLARVENYAADLLSKLEASGKDREIDLYSEDVARRLRDESEGLLQRQSELGPGEAAYLTALLRQLKLYPPHLPLAKGLIVYGTVNVDESVQMFSPKFLDRAYVLRFPCAALPKSLDQSPGTDSNPDMGWHVTLGRAEQLSDAAAELGKLDTHWKTLIGWQTEFFSPLGLYFGHRFRVNLQRYLAIGLALGFTTPANLVEDYFLAKIPPRVRFNSDERAIGKPDTLKREVFQQWLDARSLRVYKRLESRLTEMLARSEARGVVEFWD